MDASIALGSAAVSLGDCGPAPPTGPLRIRFLTQTRLKHEGMIVRRPEFHVLFRALLRRLSSLALFHCDTRLEVDYRSLIAEAEEIQLVRDETRWEEWTRYSSRQGQRMAWGGFTGRATYEATSLLSEFPPRIHNLARLGELAALRCSAEEKALLERLSLYYLQSRYPPEIQALAKNVSRSTAMAQLKQTEGLWKKLRRQLTQKN